ncbi:MAG: patatin-like phospholipase family protein, partial [Acidimicrobiia bacterium]
MTDLVPAPSLRLALALRGGVSLSVWIGGGVHEIERFRHDVILGDDDTERSVLAAIARAVGYTSVEVDVISGASAGGLNAVVLGAAMTNGKSLDMLRDVWLDDAAIEKLVYKSSHGVRLSILDGDYFYARLVANLHAIMQSDDGDRRLRAPRADVLLSVTSVVPNEVSAAPDQSAPVTEQRIGGQIHLRRRKPGADDRGPPEIDDFAVGRIDDLALSARATASFPVAFAPVKIADDCMVGRIDFRPERPDPLLLFDGGVSDNMPVGKAATAIGSAPADGPTNRVLLYLHPSPGVPDVAAAARQVAARNALAQHGARPLDVLRTALRSLRTKSLLEDLQALEAHNTNVDLQLSDRDRLLEPLLVPGPISGPGPTAGPPSSSVTAPNLDAERLIDLFVEPWEHVADLVPPMEFLPRLGQWSGDDLDLLQRSLTQELGSVRLEDAAALPALSQHSLRPWGAVIRSASLLIEWCRWAESIGFDGVSEPKAEVY